MEDNRRLGVAVSRLTLRHGTEIEPIPLDDPRLSPGWWDVEHNGATHWRWTGGDAEVLLSREGPAVLEIEMIGDQDYPLRQNLEARVASAKGLSLANAAAA
jgi:hypothetical protein